MKNTPDPLLLPLITAQNEREKKRALQQLLDQYVTPLVARIVKSRTDIDPRRTRRLFRSPHAEDAEDIYQEAMAAIGARLQEPPESVGEITALTGYIATTTYRAFYQHLRRKYPVRARLHAAVQRCLRASASLALWKAAEWIGGLARWEQERRHPENSERLRRLCSSPEIFTPQNASTHNVRLLSMDALLLELFQWLEHPLEIDRVTDVVETLLGLERAGATISLDSARDAAGGEGAPLDPPDQASDTVTLAEARAFLQRLWTQIAALPPRQCAALLLTLKDSRGRFTDIFTAAGVATRGQIAAAMGMPLARLNAIWDDLPLDDNGVAELLSTERQNIINLRHAALKRLKRHETEIL